MHKLPWPISVVQNIEPELGSRLHSLRKLNIETVQLVAPARESREWEIAVEVLESVANHEMSVSCMLFGYGTEQFSTVREARQILGLFPQHSRKQRIGEFKRISDFARVLSIPAVSLSIGYIPGETDLDCYEVLVGTTMYLCEYCRGNSQRIHLELGPHSISRLKGFLRSVGADNLFVNFNPAKTIEFGTASPEKALSSLAPYIANITCGDATWSHQPGSHCGLETDLGDGDIDYRQFFCMLSEIGYSGHLCVPLWPSKTVGTNPSERLRSIDLVRAWVAETAANDFNATRMFRFGAELRCRTKQRKPHSQPLREESPASTQERYVY